MTKEERSERRILTYPPTYLKKKVEVYSFEKKDENGKPQSESQSVIDALNFFFKHRNSIK